MKGKGSSTHHRTENTYRFQSFSERLAAVNVDVARRIQKLTAIPEDAETFFGEGLRKWSELNYTQNFLDFQKEVSGTVFSLAQLVHHQKKIITALLKHLAVPGSLAYQPLLDLVVQVARDLQLDFYPYFPEVLPVLVTLLQIHHHDVEVLEQTFTCLSYLFKILWRAMVANMDDVYRLVAPLLGKEYRDYINRFAAESFAFLMRKVKDFPALCDVMFMDLREHPDQVTGVGRLLFESVKGVQKQLHSGAEKVLEVLLGKLGAKELPITQVLDCLKSMFSSLLDYIKKEYTTPIWNPLLAHIKNVHRKCVDAENGTDGGAEHLEHLLELLHILARYKKGLLVLPVITMAEMLTDILRGPALPTAVSEQLLSVVAELLMAERVQLGFQHHASIIELVYTSAYPSRLLVTFTQNIINHSMFEKDVLPPLLVFCGKCLTKKQGVEDTAPQAAVQLLSELVLSKAPPPPHADMLEDYSVYLCDFSSVSTRCPSSKRVPGVLLRSIESLLENDFQGNVANIWEIVLCLPHIRPLKSKDATAVLLKVIGKITSSVENMAGEEADSALCLLAETVFSLLHLSGDAFFSVMDLETVLQILRVHPSNVHALRMAALYFRHMNSSGPDDRCTEATFRQLLPMVEQNLSSPHHRVRLLTLQICCEFDLPMPVLPADMSDVDQVGLFRICLEAEKVAVTLQTYRNKLMHLSKLSHDLLLNQVPVGPYDTLALRYLVGMLFVNLTLMWKPVIELIQSHAVGLKPAVFWPVYEVYLKMAAQRTESLGAVEWDVAMPDPVPPGTTPGGVFNQFRAGVTENDRPDYFNFRRLLWEAMQSFPEVCEPKSRIIVPLFFHFLDNELYPTDEAVAPWTDLSKKNEIQTEDKDEPEEHTEEGVEEEQEEAGQKKKGRKQPKPYTRLLVTQLSLFAKFRDPRSIHGHPRLRELYFELLSHRNPAVQRVAFQCLLTYKDKYLMPYKENFERLMDDKTFKNEITHFSIDPEATIVQDDHRKDVLPILMAILKGKMLTKTGKDTGGRSHAHVRRAIVYRFLAGCQENELAFFFKLVFKPFAKFFRDDIPVLTMIEDISMSTEIKTVVPLKKQQSLLATVDVVLEKLGHLLKDYLRPLLRMLLGQLAQVVQLLDLREQLAPRAVTLLKSLRQGVLTRLNQFTSRHHTYPFTTEEIQAIFKVAVWPQLEKLSREGVYSPTGLLKLILNWSQHSRFTDLFRKSWSDTDFCVLPVVLSLLAVRNVSPQVVDVVMEIIDNLLTVHEQEEGLNEQEEESESMEAEERGPPIDVGDVVKLPDSSEGAPLGVRLVLMHVTFVLDHVQRVLETLLSQKGRSKTLPVRILSVLARLSKYVTEPAVCGRLVSLLLPFLGRYINWSPAVELSVLTAVCHMVKQTSKPSSYIRPIAKVFSNLSSRASRAVLCEILESISSSEETWKPLADIVTKMNAWDKKYVEEPDYLVRLEAFRKAQSVVTTLEGDAYITHLLVIIYNCTYFINTVSDMSLRDSSSLCIQVILKDMAGRTGNSQAVSLVIREALMPEIRAGVRLKSETSRHEHITLLGHLARHFPTLPVLDDMAALTDTDVETDFFANMVHIQLHRRGRALRRVTRLLGERQFRSETLAHYVLPLATVYAQDATYNKQAVITDAVVETVAGVACHLPWPRYLLLLQRYLALLPRSLDNQKLMVRMIVAILDNFHFDLQNSTETSETRLKAPGVSSVEEVTDDATPSSKESNKVNTESSLSTTSVKKTESQENNPEGQDVDEEEENLDEEEETVTEKAEEAVVGLPVAGLPKVCPPGLATRIHRTLIKDIIPQLHHNLAKKTKSDDEHKKAKAGKYAEDEEVLRVPIALALVKLMQRLPHRTLDFNLPGLLLKVCNFLRSRAVDIRTVARGTLTSILQSLGPRYFSFVLKELRLALKRGYQLHVLCFTIHALLKSLESDFKCGDLDSSITSLVEVFLSEIFGAVAEEKNVVAITSKLMEAKATKSYDSFAVAIKFISKSSLMKVFSPLKEILESTSDQKTAGKVGDILHQMVPGLLSNESLSLSDVMTFTYGLCSEVMTFLEPKKKEQKVKPQESDPRLQPSDTYIVQPPASRKEQKVKPQESDPRLQPTDTYIVQPPASRSGKKPKTHLKTNVYIMVEFGLQILHVLLKQSKLNHKTLEHCQLTDPFVPTLVKCLASKYVKVTTTALRCLVWVFKFPLPSLKSSMTEIANSLFVLLKSYAAAGAATGENVELMDMTFKAVTVLVREVEYHSISTNELKVLLGYAEQDIHDHTRRATAFSLLKAILTRKLIAPEMKDVMTKIEEMSITAHDGQVRQNCRQVVLKYVLNYPLGAGVVEHLEFYVSHLQYEHDTGRQSALEMLVSFFEHFPTSLIEKHAALFFMPLATQLVNDETAKCRKQASLAIKQLFSKLETSTRDQLTMLVLQWFKDDKMMLRKLAALTCGLIVEVESSKFDRHLSAVLPLIEESIRPELYVSVSEEESEREIDHVLYSVLTLYSKVLRECSLPRRNQWAKQLLSIWAHVEKMLLYPHSWVRLAASQLYGLLFAAWKPQELVALSKKNSKKSVYLQHNLMEKLYLLSGAFSKQLSSSTDGQLVDQIVRNLVYLGKVLCYVKPQQKRRVEKHEGEDDQTEDTDEREDGGEKTASFEWLTNRLCGVARSENITAPRETVKRLSVFKWLAAMAVELGTERLEAHLPRMLPVLVRELTDKSPDQDEQLRKLSQEVVDLMKALVGVETFAPHYALAQKKLVDKRQARKRERKAELVADPELAAKRKLKKNLSKARAKKRKIDEQRPIKKAKKAKTIDV